ncbi:MAG: hypothetical protein HKN37_04115 [Rhodothermales bacterium]|nr:hypothetical protein [Rhodothermales bacterium]
MDKYTVVIILTAVGFFGLAALLLVPIWRFLNSEQKRGDEWTKHLRKTQSGVMDDMSSDVPPDQDGLKNSEAHDNERS